MSGTARELHQSYELGGETENFSRLLLYCETSVNDGSPSGYHPTVPTPYSPTAGHRGFTLPFVALEPQLVTTVGPVPTWIPTSHTHILVPVHPIVAAGRMDLYSATLTVIPTASVRTVAVLSDEEMVSGFLKLHYPTKLGRFSRDLYHFKWIASLEADAAFREAAASAPIIWLPENYGWYCEPPLGSTERGWGVLGRAFGENLLKRPLIPAFSIISKNSQYAVLKYLQSVYSWTAKQASIELALQLVISYIELALNWGLMPECNAQNVLYQLCQDGHVRPVFRDMGDVFKDIAIRKTRGLSITFSRYKTIDNTSEDLFQRRSFSYDFKLGEYILQPTVDAIASVWRIRPEVIHATIRQECVEAWGSRATDYFGNRNRWFSYPAEEYVSRESYVVNNDPAFR